MSRPVNLSSSSVKRQRPLAYLEALEARVAPATILTQWTGGSGNWADPAHWSNGVPNNEDGLGNSYQAIIDVPSTITVTVNSTIAVSLLANTANLQVVSNGDATIGDYVSYSGTMSSRGSMTVSGTGHVTLSPLMSDLPTTALGAIHVNGGTFSLGGTLLNDGSVLIVDAPSGTWELSGATIVGGAVIATTGSKLSVSTAGARLDGVLLNAELSIVGDNAPAIVDVVHGLTLNATATIGDYGFLNFDGTQTFAGTGTVLFTDGFASGLVQSGTKPTLTIASGLTIRGGSSQSSGANIGDSDYFGSVAGGTIINEGKISADVPGTTLFLNRSLIVNHASGTIEAKNAGTLTISDLSSNAGTLDATTSGQLRIDGEQWVNTGTLRETSATLVFDGTFTTAGLGTLTVSGGDVLLAGHLINTGATFTLAASANWLLYGGWIQGGTVQSSGGSKLALTAELGMLDGVTLNADLDVTAGSVNTGADIIHGLTLNGVATMGANAVLRFQGNQTLGGTGAVFFQDAPRSALYVAEAGTTLTIGPTMTIHGGSAQDEGARIGYSNHFGGPSFQTVVNLGKISADVTGTSLNILGGRFIDAGVTEELNGGTLNIPVLVPTVHKVLSKTSAPYTFQDADGTPVSVKWLGAGTVTLVRFANAGDARGDLFSITADGSNLTSSLTITTTGAAGTTSVETIDIHGSLKSIAAPKTNLLGDVTSANSIGALTFAKVDGSVIKIGPRATGDTKTSTALTFDLVADLRIDSATPLLSLTAAQWLDSDTTPDIVKAPSLGTLTIKAAVSRALASDFQAGLELTGIGVFPKALTLGKATVSGQIAFADWLVTGNVGPIAAGSTSSDWSTHFSGSLVSFTTTGHTSGNINIGTRATGDVTTATIFALDSAEELSIHTDTPIKSLTALQWRDRTGTADVLDAPSLGTLTIKGAPARMIAGDFEADLTLTGVGVAAKKLTLGAVVAAGKITAGSWSIHGLAGSVKAGAFTQTWLADFKQPIGALTTTGEATGSITIGPRPTGDTKSRTSLSFDTAAELSIHSQTPISSLTVRNWVDADGTPDVILAPVIGILSVKGDTKATRPLPGDFQAGLTLSGAGLPVNVKTLGSVTVKGKIDDATWAITGDTGTIATGSTTATWAATFTKTIGSVSAATLSGSLQAASIRTITATNVDHLTLALSQGVSATTPALGTLTVKNAIESSDIRTAGNIGSMSAAKITHSQVFAGVQSAVALLPQSPADFAAVATIAKLTITATAESGLSSSYIAASKITSASIGKFSPLNSGQPFGLAADSIDKLTFRTTTAQVMQSNLTAPTADVTGGGDDFVIRIL